MGGADYVDAYNALLINMNLIWHRYPIIINNRNINNKFIIISRFARWFNWIIFANTVMKIIYLFK